MQGLRVEKHSTMRNNIFLLILFFYRPIDAFQGFLKDGRFQRSPLAFTAAPIEEKVDAAYTFRSPETKVFIEDTDAYGIMYNGNYLRSYDRALHICTLPSLANNKTGDEARVTTQHESWSIVSMGYQKFVSSPLLGGDFVVEGNLKDSSNDLEVWDLKMTSPDGETVFNTVQDLKIARPTNSDRETTENKFSLEHIEPFSFDEEESAVTGTAYAFPVHRDEIDAHWTGHLPLRNVLNFFERARSSWFGGPDDLQRLQMEEDIIVVVASIGDCSLIDDQGSTVYPGEFVSVETSYVVKRRGMVIDCYQTLKAENGSRLAQGKVTLMLIKNSTRRPTSKLPDWVKERLGLVV